MRRVFKKTKNNLRQSRRARVRACVKGNAKRPRLSVFRGLREMNLQLIDDTNSRTLCSVNTSQIKSGEVGERKGKVAKSYLAGLELAKKAKELNIELAVFDRGGYKYHGRVSVAADGARDGGLKF